MKRDMQPASFESEIRRQNTYYVVRYVDLLLRESSSLEGRTFGL